MLSRCTPRWRDMGAAVGGTSQIDYRGGRAGKKYQHWSLGLRVSLND